MKGEKLREIRRKHGLSRVDLGRRIGYLGNDNTIETRIKMYEQNRRQIPLYIARLAYLFGQCAPGELPRFPQWGGYTDHEKIAHQRQARERAEWKKEGVEFE